MAGQAAWRPGSPRLAAAARGIRQASRGRRRLPGSRRHHRPRTGHRAGTAPRQPRTRGHAPDRDPRPGNTRRSGERAPHDPGRARGPDPRRRTRPSRRPARRIPGITAHRPKPKPTPCSNPPTPRSSMTRPDRRARRRSLTTWRPGASSSKPRTPTTRHGPRTLAGGGNQPVRPGPSWSGAGSPTRQRNSGRPKPEANRRPWWSGGASSKPTSPPWTGPSSASTRPPSLRQALAPRARARTWSATRA